MPTAGQDPALSLNHPFYDVARHGILQVAGGSQLEGSPGTLTVPAFLWEGSSGGSLQCGCAYRMEMTIGTKVPARVLEKQMTYLSDHGPSALRSHRAASCQSLQSRGQGQVDRVINQRHCYALLHVNRSNKCLPKLRR